MKQKKLPVLSVGRSTDPLANTDFHLERGSENIPVSTRISAKAERAAKIIIDSDLSPYDCMADMLRHGFHIVCDRWSEALKNQELKAVWDSERTLQNFLSDQQEKQRVRAEVQKVSQIVRFHVEDGEPERVEFVLSGFIERLGVMEDDYWKKRWTKEFWNHKVVKQAIEYLRQHKPDSEVLEWVSDGQNT